MPEPTRIQEVAATLDQQVVGITAIHAGVSTVPMSGGGPASSLPVGRYVLGGEIAHGGMGAVHAARDTHLGRDVAVKVLLDDLTGTASERRFRDEACITGQLQHPGIPPVYDLGILPDGRPYLAMKLIKGHTLEALLQRHGPGGRWLPTFEGICQAVGYAHAHGVIHRDLKPSNVMVGAFGEVQVMDWGLAKVLTGGEQPAADSPVPATRTEIRSQRDDGDKTRGGYAQGTPAYMPPEQAIGNTAEIDRRSDVFGLGAVLCSMLTGQPPYLGPDGLSTLALAARAKLDDALGRLDACDADPELVALCRRCLSPERDARPADAGVVAQTVAELRTAADDRAKRAELTSAEERVRATESLRRRRMQLTAGVLLLAVLGVGASVSVWQAVRATAAERQAVVDRDKARDAEARAVEEERKEQAARERAEGLKTEAEAAARRADAAAVDARKSEQQAKASEAKAVEREQAEKVAKAHAVAVSDFMRSVFRQSGSWVQASRDRRVNLDITVREAMWYAAERLGQQFASQPEIEAALRTDIGGTLRELDAIPEAEQHLRRAYDLRVEHLGRDHVDTLETMGSLTYLHYMKRDFKTSVPMCRELLGLTEAKYGASSHATLQRVRDLGEQYMVSGDARAAQALYREWLGVSEAAHGIDHEFSLSLVNQLAGAELALGKPDVAEKHYLRVVETGERAGRKGSYVSLAGLSGLADIATRKGDLQDAERLLLRVEQGYEQASGPEAAYTLSAVVALAGHYERMKKHVEAEQYYKKALDGYDRTHGQTHQTTIGRATALAEFYLRQGNAVAAEPLLRRAVDHYAKATGPDQRFALEMANRLGVVYWRMGRLDRSVPLFEDLLKRRRAEHGDDHEDTLNDMANLGVNYKDAGRVAEAVPLLEHAHAARDKYPRLGWVAPQLADAYVRAGRAADAVKVLDGHLTHARKVVKPDSVELGGLLANAGSTLLSIDPVTAEQVLRECLAVREKLAPTGWAVANAKTLLGESLRLQGDYDAAEPLLLAGHTGLVADAANTPPQARGNLPVATDRLIRLYIALDRPAEVAKWRAERAKYPPEVAPRPRPAK